MPLAGALERLPVVALSEAPARVVDLARVLAMALELWLAAESGVPQVWLAGPRQRVAEASLEAELAADSVQAMRFGVAQVSALGSLAYVVSLVVDPELLEVDPVFETSG